MLTKFAIALLVLINLNPPFVSLTDILLKMTNDHFGCCVFMDKTGKKIEGILLDGDIRRLLIDNPSLSEIGLEEINRTFNYETDLDKMVGEIDKHLKYIPVLEKDGKGLIGMVKV